jgi:alkanesulfonate monooxygenase SsuD/methylene tetrahydromethanopterin reductase-like flavin-dependent oxidoreductase (luciferase family)
LTGPTTLAEHVSPTLREADGDRPVRVVAALPVSVTDDVDGARAQAAKQLAMYGHLPSYRAMLDREGYAGPEDAAIIGDESTVAERIRALGTIGVDEYVGVVFDASPENRARTRALLRSLDS